MNNVSVVVIVKNGSAHLDELLSTTSEFGEVVIYDNGSTDDTELIAKKYSNVSWHSGPFYGFGETKNRAVCLAKNDWILSLDADEFVTQELKDGLKEFSFDERNVGLILRENLFLGKKVRHSGWGGDWLVRIFNRKKAQFNFSKVHESVVFDPAIKVSKISGAIRHYAVDDISQFLEKVNRYSSIRADSGLKPKHPSIVLIKTVFAFFRTYFIRLGILDGWPGLVIAVSNANGVFWKYMKAYALNESKDS